jgi:hypothetical protein
MAGAGLDGTQITKRLRRSAGKQRGRPPFMSEHPLPKVNRGIVGKSRVGPGVRGEQENPGNITKVSLVAPGVRGEQFGRRMGCAPACGGSKNSSSATTNSLRCGPAGGESKREHIVRNNLFLPRACYFPPAPSVTPELPRDNWVTASQGCRHSPDFRRIP